MRAGGEAPRRVVSGVRVSPRCTTRRELHNSDGQQSVKRVQLHPPELVLNVLSPRAPVLNVLVGLHRQVACAGAQKQGWSRRVVEAGGRGGRRWAAAVADKQRHPAAGRRPHTPRWPAGHWHSPQRERCAGLTTCKAVSPHLLAAAAGAARSTPAPAASYPTCWPPDAGTWSARCCLLLPASPAAGTPTQ